MPPSPKSSPEPSRNPSPVSSPIFGAKIGTEPYSLTPPVSPSRSLRKLNEAENDSPIQAKRSYSPFSEQATPPNSPSRNYSYYTDSTDSSLSSPSNSYKKTFYSKESSSRSYCNGKIIHCPSTSPASPSRRPCQKTNHYLPTPPASPMHRRRENKKETSSPSQPSTSSTPKSSRSVIKQVLKKNATLRKANWLHYQKETKSLDTNSLTCSSGGLNPPSMPSSPIKERKEAETKVSPSRFCQVVTKLLPQLITMNNSSKPLKRSTKSTPKHPTNVYVDKDGNTSVIPTEPDVGDKLSASRESSASSLSEINKKSLDSVVFEFCKTTHKIGEDNYNLQKNKEVSQQSASEPKNANIIINPIYSLESKLTTTDSSVSIQTLSKSKITTCSAFLKDDIIYVETCTSDQLDKIYPPVDSVSKNSSKMENHHRLNNQTYIHNETMPIDLKKDADFLSNSTAVNKEQISCKGRLSSKELPPSPRKFSNPVHVPRPSEGATPPPIPPRKSSMARSLESTPPPIPPRKNRLNSDSYNQSQRNL